MKKSKIRVMILLIISILVITTGCSGTEKDKEQSATGTGEEKIQVITTLFPQYDFVREIGKDKVEVSLLIPPGVEAHSYDPTPRDIVSIQKSNVFIYTGEYMEPWAHRVIESINGSDVIIVDASNKINLMDEDDHEEDHHDHDHDHDHDDHDDHDHDHDHGGKDPHIWVDPVYAQIMVDNILEGLIVADPENESFYVENAEAYKATLNELHGKFTEAFEKIQYRTIIYGGHFAFGYFTKRYDLNHISPYVGFAPDAEPTPQRIANLIKNINETGVKVIYYEELIDPKVARVISEQTGAEMLLLHAAHNISKEELNSGITYMEIMEGNLERLKIGLGYIE